MANKVIRVNGQDVVLHAVEHSILHCTAVEGVFGRGAEETQVTTEFVTDYADDPRCTLNPAYLCSHVQLTLLNEHWLIHRQRLMVSSSADIRSLITVLTTMAGHLEAMEQIQRDTPMALLEEGFKNGR